MSGPKFNVTIDSVINDERKEPLSREDYHIFLESRYCSENLDFLVAVNDWQQGKLDSPGGDGAVVVEVKEAEESASKDQDQAKAGGQGQGSAASGDSVLRAKREALWICERFVVESAPLQVNISSSCRSRLLELVQAIKDESRDPGVFGDAYKEIRNLLLRDAWEPWVVEQTSRNIGKEEVVNRYTVSMVAFAVSVAIFVGCLVGGGKDLSPFWRLFTIIPNFVGSAYLWSAKTGVCSGLAAKGTRMHRDRAKNKGWFAAFFEDGEGSGYCSIKQQDPDISNHIRHISKLNGIRSTVMALVLTTVFVVAHDW